MTLLITKCEWMTSHVSFFKPFEVELFFHATLLGCSGCEQTHTHCTVFIRTSYLRTTSENHYILFLSSPISNAAKTGVRFVLLVTEHSSYMFSSTRSRISRFVSSIRQCTTPKKKKKTFTQYKKFGLMVLYCQCRKC